MKNLVRINLLSLVFLMSSCQEDDICLLMDIEGIYAGTKECDEMNPENVTFEITAGNGDIQIIIDGVPTTIEECDIFGSSVVNGTGREIDGDIDGNKISFIETNKVNGQVSLRCFWEGIKQ